MGESSRIVHSLGPSVEDLVNYTSVSNYDPCILKLNRKFKLAM